MVIAVCSFNVAIKGYYFYLHQQAGGYVIVLSVCQFVILWAGLPKK